MRTILLAALLAGTATPALAAPDDRFDPRDRARAERAERAERPEPAPARAQRAEPRAQRDERRQVRLERNRGEPAAAAAPVEDRQLRSRVLERAAPVSRDRLVIGRNREIVAPARGEPALRSRVQREAVRSGDSVRDWRANERRRTDSASAIHERNLRSAPRIDRSREDLAQSSLPAGPIAPPEGLVEQSRPLPRVLDRDRTRVSRRAPAPDAQAPEPATARLAHARPSRHWRTDWRRDRRYDWREHRERNRARFRLGFYYDPFGWHYHRYGIGWRLWPSHYGQRYWLHDPWMYRLPLAYGPYRWIRYWDDALLVNIYTGQVVDVVHNFFW